jgi:hypothetical protein
MDSRWQAGREFLKKLQACVLERGTCSFIYLNFSELLFEGTLSRCILDVYISELKGHSKLSLNRFGHFSRKMTENQPYPSTAACAAPFLV